MTSNPKTPRVHVVPYRPEWREHFGALRDLIWPEVSAFALSIEHVGSTSVPGLAAKPIIDLDVIVSGEDEVAACITRLATLGYEHRGELGIVGRHAFGRPPGGVAHNLYVCLDGAPSLRNHLVLRDHLRAHPEDAARYGALKLSLAKQFPEDIGAYIEGKTALIVEILRRYDFQGDELDAIAGANEALKLPE